MWTRVALLPRRHNNVCATVLKWRVYFLSLVCFKAIFSREPSLVLQIVARDQARLARLGAIDAQRLE